MFSYDFWKITNGKYSIWSPAPWLGKSCGFILNMRQPQQNKNRHFAPMCNVQVAQFSNNTNRANQAHSVLERIWIKGSYLS